MKDVYKSICPKCEWKTVVRVIPNQIKDDVLIKCNACGNIYKASFKK